ncbi:hypothetical protein ACUYGN_13610 [Enterobacter chengduensis]|uniref:hypothetical protein n=1 Tax=Enterobacter TaxID=547 RepID=UPI000667946E|nr:MULTISPECIES: hypothetical protein [Enterobacter]ELV3043795.1 hypothetical protein [Enterobacter chengduensis]MCK7280431.1 hypothetical protein [Enterobacter chengduensis]MCM7425225.1 hypothetical protein [Enterobacter chengduensis]MDY0421582.1 hypothetical protein [Enterobacter sp. 170250]GFZ54005.1 hypothetical protein ENTKAS01_15290 [Enterobacter sp. AS-1]
MLRHYTEGARALIIIIFSSLALTLCAIAIVFISYIDPEPKRITFNVPEFVPTKIENDVECQLERALQVIFVDDLVEWLNTSDRRAFCMKKKSEGYWVIYAMDEMKNNMSTN